MVTDDGSMVTDSDAPSAVAETRAPPEAPRAFAVASVATAAPTAPAAPLRGADVAHEPAPQTRDEAVARMRAWHAEQEASRSAATTRLAVVARAVTRMARGDGRWDIEDDSDSDDDECSTDTAPPSPPLRVSPPPVDGEGDARAARDGKCDATRHRRRRAPPCDDIKHSDAAATPCDALDALAAFAPRRDDGGAVRLSSRRNVSVGIVVVDGAEYFAAVGIGGGDSRRHAACTRGDLPASRGNRKVLGVALSDFDLDDGCTTAADTEVIACHHMTSHGSIAVSEVEERSAAAAEVANAANVRARSVGGGGGRKDI